MSGSFELLDSSLTISLGNQAFAPHFHDGYAIGVILGGGCIVSVAGHAAVARPGDLIVINPWEVHTAAPEDQGVALEYHVIHPSLGLMDECAHGSQSGNIPLFNEPVIRDPALGHELAALLERSGNGQGGLEPLALRHFLARLSRTHSRASKTAQSRPPLPDAVERACQFVADNLYDTLHLEDLASAAHVSRFHFCRLFRRAVGLTPSEYVRQSRAFAAAQLIGEGVALADAAAAVGFADQAHMTRSIKLLLGITPGRLSRQLVANSIQ